MTWQGGANIAFSAHVPEYERLEGGARQSSRQSHKPVWKWELVGGENRGAPHPSGSRQVDWAARITHVQGEICCCLILVITFEKLRAVRRGATGRDEGLILVSAGYAHPCLFEDLILPTRNFKNIKFCRISVQFVLSCFRSLATTFLPATEAGTGG